MSLDRADDTLVLLRSDGLKQLDCVHLFQYKLESLKELLSLLLVRLVVFRV